MSIVHKFLFCRGSKLREKHPDMSSEILYNNSKSLVYLIEDLSIFYIYTTILQIIVIFYDSQITDYSDLLRNVHFTVVTLNKDIFLNIEYLQQDSYICHNPSVL